jgi:hypothetical protein
LPQTAKFTGNQLVTRPELIELIELIEQEGATRFFDKYGLALGGVWHQARSNWIEAGIKFGQVIVWPDHDAPGQSYAGQIAMMLHRDFDTAAQIVPISGVFLCKVTDQTLGETNRALSPLHKGWDVADADADAVAQGWGVTEINRLVTLTLGGSQPPKPILSLP